MPSTKQSRNHTSQPGVPFQDTVDLPGWEAHSVWGFDAGSGMYFARLWRNAARSSEPETRISGLGVPCPRPECVALAIAERLGLPARTVVTALAIETPKPRLRPHRKIDKARVELAQRRRFGGFLEGKMYALNWLTGRGDESPGSTLLWRGAKPSAVDTAAEHRLVTGRRYRPEDYEFYTGVDEAFRWARKHTETLTACADRVATIPGIVR